MGEKHPSFKPAPLSTYKRMASSAMVTNRLPSRLEVDHRAVEKQKAAEYSAQSLRIQHEREVKLADEKRRHSERTNTSMARKTEDLENNLHRSVHEKMTMEQINHDLKVDRDRLQHNLDNEVRRCQREKEKMEKDFNLKMESHKMKNDMEIEINKKKADEMKAKAEKKIEKLETKKANLAETISAKEAEISDLKTKKKDEKDKKQLQLVEGFEEKLRKIQAEHNDDLAERDLLEKKLAVDKKNLERDIEKLKKDNENQLEQQKHEFQKTMQDTMEDINTKQRKKFTDLEQEISRTEKKLK